MVDLSAAEPGPQLRPRISRQLRLPFEPLEMCLAASSNKLIVAGAFQSALAVADTDSLERFTIKRLPGHNIRGLAITRDGQRILVAQQELNSLARSTRDDVHWGNMISNLLVSFSLAEVCDAQSTYTSPRSYDVALTDTAGNHRFNPPSLRGVARRQAFFHDARVTSLADVFSKHQHQLPRQLSATELSSLIEFLKSI